MGVKGARPLGLPPPLGERGGHPPNVMRILSYLKKISLEKTLTLFWALPYTLVAPPVSMITYYL
jgi:hypothetical protein